MAGADPKDARRRAQDELSSSLEQLSVKSIIEFRGQKGVSQPVEQVAAAALCTIANIDDTVECPDDGVPDRSWAGAQAAMAKPGHFINALRRFPYAVDSGRMPDRNIDAAQECLEGLNPADLEETPCAQHLLQWVRAAENYWVVQQATRSAPDTLNDDTGGLAGGLAEPVSDVIDSLGYVVEAAEVALGYAVEAAEVASPPRSPPRAAPPPARTAVLKATRVSTGSRASSGYNTSSMPDSPDAAARSHQPSRGGGVAAPRPQIPVSRVSRPPARRASAPLAKSGMPPRTVTDMTIEDWQRQLEQVKRETREMKAMEQGAKWQMKREEDIKKKEDYKAATDDIQHWRVDASNGMRDYIKDVKVGTKKMELIENRDFQDFKREHKNEEKQIDQLNIKECYEDTKDISEWEAQISKDKAPEERRLIIEANLEKYQLFAEYNTAEAAFEDAEEQDSKALDRQLLMNIELDRAREEQELAAKSLEHARQAHEHAVAGADRVELQPSMVTGLDPQQ